ncbi:MAG: hypothetical protein WCF85_18230 [Rhodospirillaceae bacterium]
MDPYLIHNTVAHPALALCNLTARVWFFWGGWLGPTLGGQVCRQLGRDFQQLGCIIHDATLPPEILPGEG